MKILITGGMGFIGSHLAEELLKRGDRVYLIDNLSTGSIDNIEAIKDNKNLSFKIESIMNENVMRPLIKKCNIVYHMAAAVGVKYVIDNPLESIQVNVKGTEVLLELCNEYGKKKVVLASTSEIYGKNIDGARTFKETDDRLLGSTTISRWGYSCTKALDEFLALAYHREKKLPVVIVRLFNTVGPRQTGNYGMVVPRFIKQALMNHPITVFGDGRQTRSFTYISDVVKAIIALGESKKAEGEIFNVGNQKGIAIEDLAKKIKKLIGSESKIIHVPYEQAYEKGFEDMRHRMPNIDKLRKITGFSPETDIDEILDKTVEYFRK
jgi:UDP-glucose 4-epimerase